MSSFCFFYELKTNVLEVALCGWTIGLWLIDTGLILCGSWSLIGIVVWTETSISVFIRLCILEDFLFILLLS